MEPEELVRLKHITGYSKLYAEAGFTPSWKSKEQIKFQKEDGVLKTAK